MELKDLRAVVTGGASGIGRAIAADLLARGAQVMIADVDGDRLPAVARELGPQAWAQICDVADPASVEALADAAERELGPVDLVFANAGVTLSKPLLKATPEEFDWIYGVNIRGVWSTVAAFASRMVASGRPGRLCLTGSEHSLGLQHAGAGFYTASKHAVLGLGEVLRAEAPSNLTYSVLCPGLVSTDIHRSLLHSPFPKPEDAQLAVGEAIMRRGMPAAEVARAAVDGVMRGDFLIVTHAISRLGADKRAQEVAAAFATLAPWTAGAERYDVNRVRDAVLADLAAKRPT